MKLLKEEVLRFGGRDIILVELDDGSPQPFYRSSGKNSGCKGTWFPFDGICNYFGYGTLWFNKYNYVTTREYYRYGSQELKNVSDWLALQDIPKGEIKTPFEINEFLNTSDSLFANNDEFIKNWTFEPEKNKKHFK